MISFVAGACSTVLYNMEATLSRRRPRVLIGATGSVATVKVPELATKVAAFAEVPRTQKLTTCTRL